MSGLLLDTHVLLWASADPARLGPATSALLVDPTVRLHVSAVSVAEIAIKRSIGKLEMDVPVSALLGPLGASGLALTPEQAEAVERLPLLHRDPFDRLLLAHAMIEDLQLVTADDRMLAYPVPVVDARC